MFSSASRLLGLAGAGAASVICAAAIAAPASASAAACAQATPTNAMSSSSQSPCWRPFTSNSPVNTILPSSPALSPSNSAISGHMARYGWYFGDTTSGFTFNENDGTRPVYFGAQSDPTYTIRCTYEEGPGTCQGSNDVNINGAVVHVPAGAQPTDNSDAHMVIVESASGQEYDLWHTSVSGHTITAGNGSETDVNTSNGTGGSGDAGDLALTAGLLTPQQLASGHINHALVIDIPCTDATGPNVGYVWPASGGWGTACGQGWNESTAGAPGMGQLFKLNLTASQIAHSGAPAWEQTIMTALATYGAYAEDTNGDWHEDSITIFSQDPISYTSIGQPNAWNTAINELGGHNGTLQSNVAIPVSALEAINPCVPQGTCPAASGPATPSSVMAAPQQRARHAHHARSRRARSSHVASLSRLARSHRGEADRSRRARTGRHHHHAHHRSHRDVRGAHRRHAARGHGSHRR